jgi:hypothetical protein
MTQGIVLRHWFNLSAHRLCYTFISSQGSMRIILWIYYVRESSGDVSYSNLLATHTLFSSLKPHSRTHKRTLPIPSFKWLSYSARQQSITRPCFMHNTRTWALWEEVLVSLPTCNWVICFLGCRLRYQIAEHARDIHQRLEAASLSFLTPWGVHLRGWSPRTPFFIQRTSLGRKNCCSDSIKQERHMILGVTQN